MAAAGRLFIASWAAQYNDPQSSYAMLQKALKNYSTTWFMRSVAPSVSGWYAVESFLFIFKSLQMTSQTSPANCLPLSETVEFGGL